VVEIHYCPTRSGYEPRATSLVAMLRERGVEADAIPGGKGQFDVIRDGEVVFSKHAEHRFPGEGEIERLVGSG
jgi:selT/selW/selH-like putative selenoprotein